jgi:hypothetical protein
MGRSSWRTSLPAPARPRASSWHPVADRGLDLILSLGTPLTEEKRIPSAVALGIPAVQTRGVPVEWPPDHTEKPATKSRTTRSNSSGGWWKKVTRWLGDALWACQNSVAGILRDRAIGGGVRVGDDLKERTWLREPVPPREEVLGTAW